MTLAMKMEVKTQLHIDWGGTETGCWVGNKIQFQLRGGCKCTRMNGESETSFWLPMTHGLSLGKGQLLFRP